MFTQGNVQQFIDTCQPGDCLFWWGTAWLSHAIERLTHGGPSHVAMVRRIESRTPAGIILVESTEIQTPKKFIGVVERRFADELAEYVSDKGAGVFAPIRFDLRARSDWDRWGAWMDSQIHHPYDYIRMVTEAINARMDRIPVLSHIAAIVDQNRNLSREFCSEIACAGFQDIGILSPTRNPALTAPVDSLRTAMFGAGIQILGPPLAGDFGYNTVAP